MLDKIFPRNKKAQVSDAMSWVVATLVIITLLSVSLYATSILAKTKVVGYVDNERDHDFVMVESLLTYFQLELLDSTDLSNEILSNLEFLDNEGKFYQNFDEELNEIGSVLEDG